MLIALRDFSVKNHQVRAGDSVSAEVQALLPPGRISSLKAVRFVEEIPTSGDEHMDQLLGEYEQTVAYLKAGIKRLTAEIAELQAASNNVEVV